MNQKDLYRALRRTAWAYILLYVDFNIGTVNILPDWWAFILLVTVIPTIAEQEESAKLLTPLGIFLTVIEAVVWINDCCFAGAFPLYLISIVAGAINLYFHFQFFTNLASIAGKHGCKEETSILKLRTINTVLNTIAIVFSTWQINHLIMTGLLFVLMVVAVFICKVLFSFSNSLDERLSELKEEVFVND